MKLVCTQENLNKGLFIVGHLSSKNVNLPILNNVLLKAENNILKLATTNLEIGISCLVRGKIESDGEFTVDSKLFSDYLSLLPKGNVEVELDNNDFLKINCENYNTKIKGMSASDFPVLPSIEKKNPFICKVSDLKNAISQVIYAVSTNESRNELTGVLMDFNNFEAGKITLTATDSYRLSEKKVKLENSTEEKQTVIVPSKTLFEISRILGGYKEAIDAPQTIEIAISENQIVFSYDNIELISRLIEGTYPDYKQIIPKESKAKMSIRNESIIKAVKTNSLFSQNGIFDISLEYVPEEKNLKLSSTNISVGENVSKIDVEGEGEKNNIVLNYKYLLDGLQNSYSEEITLELIDSKTPCIIRSKDDPEFLYIVMPIKQ